MSVPLEIPLALILGSVGIALLVLEHAGKLPYIGTPRRPPPQRWRVRAQITEIELLSSGILPERSVPALCVAAMWTDPVSQIEFRFRIHPSLWTMLVSPLEVGMHVWVTFDPDDPHTYEVETTPGAKQL